MIVPAILAYAISLLFSVNFKAIDCQTNVHVAKTVITVDPANIYQWISIGRSIEALKVYIFISIVCLWRGKELDSREDISQCSFQQHCVSMKGIGSGEALCVLSSSVLCAYEEGMVIEKLSKHIDYCLLHFCMFMKRRLVTVSSVF